MNLPVDDPIGQGRTDTAEQDVARRAATRKLLDAVFGDVLPNVAGDERDDGQDGPPGSTERDQWFRDNRPPHHG